MTFSFIYDRPSRREAYKPLGNDYGRPDEGGNAMSKQFANGSVARPLRGIGVILRITEPFEILALTDQGGALRSGHVMRGDILTAVGGQRWAFPGYIPIRFVEPRAPVF
jgi:hypothetical protein